MNSGPIVVARTFNAEASRVWRALTDVKEMKAWYFDVPEFRPEVGCRFTFSGGPDHKVFLHICDVVEVIPERKITYTWRYDGYAGETLVTFRLKPEGAQTLLELTHEKLDSFPEDVPELARANFEAGWSDIINRSLRGYLEQH